MLEEELKRRILVLDGAMGTLLRKYSFSKEDFAGAVGCYEMLNITRSEVIEEIHRNYIAVGADILETNSFHLNSSSLKKYHLEEKVYEFSKKSAEIANKAGQNSQRKIYILGSIAANTIQKEDYLQQILGLLDGSVDGLMLETVFHSDYAEAALLAIEEIFSMRKKKLPLFISASVTHEGKLWSGEKVEEFFQRIDRPSIISFGLNCSKAEELLPWIFSLREKTKKYLSIHPSAGLPDLNGRYNEDPIKMAEKLLPLLERNIVRVIGGCCGTSYEHIEAIAKLVKK